MSRKQPECHEKVKLSLTTGSRASRLAKPCRDARGCGEAHLELLPCIPLPPASTTWKTIRTVTSTPGWVTQKPSVLSHPPLGGGHLKTIRNVTRGLRRAARRQQLPPPSGGGVCVLFFYPPQKAVCSFVACNMSLACGNDAQINHGLPSRLTWDGFYFNDSSTCGNRAGVTLCCCFNPIVSQTEILGGFVFFQIQSELTPKAPRCHYLMFVCTGWE